MTTKRLVRISYFTMLTVIGGLISIPLPFSPIKLTFQTLFVIMSGMILGGKDGAFAQIAYMLIGLIGLPIFSAGGGFDYVLRPSFGYILSFPLAAFIAGVLISKQKTLNPFKLFLCAFAGCVSNYIVGVVYQVIIIALYTGVGWAAAIAGLATIPLMLLKDAILIFIVCLIYPRIMTMIGKTAENKKDSEERIETDVIEGESVQGGEKEPEPAEKPKKKSVPEPAGMTDGN